MGRLRDGNQLSHRRRGTPISDRLVVEIRDHMEVLVDHRAQVGVKLVQLRAAVEASGAPWWPWLDANEHRFLVKGKWRGKIGRREIERLLKIGRDKNPQEALESERTKAREGGMAATKFYLENGDAETDDEPPREIDDVEFGGVEDPEHVLANALESINEAKLNAEAYRKIFKASSFGRKAKEQLKDAIDLLIRKWRRVHSTPRQANRGRGRGPAPRACHPRSAATAWLQEQGGKTCGGTGRVVG